VSQCSPSFLWSGAEEELKAGASGLVAAAPAECTGVQAMVALSPALTRPGKEASHGLHHNLLLLFGHLWKYRKRQDMLGGILGLRE
jgi:hypothetical protein